eukprot:TRINITY_DN22498_c0_g1_i1.p1 TRINITY_DN22498_c0_g1~~TRINITY_DN22498_c0_g1_i1.p1  ORF type:complete len:1203 (-),score=172.97 TRINITY_DN22498_c0_g1_i1:211-3819(-)
MRALHSLASARDDGTESLGGVSAGADSEASHYGSLQCDWISLLGKSVRKSRNADDPRAGYSSVYLPSHLVPEIRWETVPYSSSTSPPVGRQGHSLLPVAPLRNRTERQQGEHFFVIGGCGEVPIDVPRESYMLLQDKAPARGLSPDAYEGSLSLRHLRFDSHDVPRGVQRVSPTAAAGKRVLGLGHSQFLTKDAGGGEGSLPRRLDLGPTAVCLTPAKGANYTFAPPASPASPTSPATSPRSSPRLERQRTMTVDANAASASQERGKHSKSPEPSSIKKSVVREAELAAEWSSPQAELPRKLVGCVACALNGGRRVAVFGGLESDRDNVQQVTKQLKILEVVTGVWRDETAAEDGPPACFEHAAASPDGSREMLVHGGRSSSAAERAGEPPLAYLKHLEVCDKKVVWKELAPRSMDELRSYPASHRVLTSPPGRRAHSMVAESGRTVRFYVFGGISCKSNGGNQVCADLNVLDADRGLWLTVDVAGSGPGPRAYHSATLAGAYMVVFGGVNASGVTLQDLRLLYLPMLVWTAPKFGETINGPCDRALHATACVTSCTRPGTHSLLVFGGRGSNGELLKDMRRLVLTKPTRPIGNKWGLTDGAIRYVEEEFHVALKELQDGYVERVDDITTKQSELKQDARNLETRRLAAEAQTFRFDSLSQKLRSETKTILAELAEADARLLEQEKEGRLRLRELEIEAESLLARMQRLRREQVGVVEGLTARDDVEVNPEGHKAVVLPNPLCPKGSVDRYPALWKGATVGVEVISSGVEMQQRMATQTLGGERDHQTLTDTMEFRHQLRKAVYSEDASKDDYDPFVHGLEMDGTNSNKAPWVSWSEATCSELAVMKLLRHPNIQEVYGAIADSFGIVVMVEQFVRTLREVLPMSVLGNKGHWVQLENLPLSTTSARPSQRFRQSALATNSKWLATRSGTAESAEDITRACEEEYFLTENDRYHVTCDVVNALDYLHAKGVAHRHLTIYNIFVYVDEDMGVTAKVGAHFSARVACRATGEHYVVDELGGLPKDLCELAKLGAGLQKKSSEPELIMTATKTDRKMHPQTAQQLQEHMQLVDARPADIMAFGLLLLKLWQPLNPPPLEAIEIEPMVFMGMRDLVEELVRCKREGTLDLSSTRAVDLAIIRDESLRLMAARCMTPNAEGGLPSARQLRMALTEMRSDDINTIPAVQGTDPTRHSVLADIVGVESY